MITSIFSKSKPINFLIVFFVALLALFLAVYKYEKIDLSLVVTVKLSLVFLGCYLSVLLVDFIVSKNTLSQKSNYEVILFSAFLLAIPQVFLHYEVVISNLLILFATRRILSIRTHKESIKKLFDAGFLIGLASLFYFWSILFFLIIFVAIIYYTETSIRNFIVPFLGLICVAILSVSASLVVNNSFFLFFNLTPAISFNLNNYNSMQFIIAFTMLLSFGLWSSWFFIRNIKKKMKTVRPSYNVVFSMSIVAGIILLIAPEKNGSEFLFLFAPLAIIISNYIETIEEKWFKETFTALLLIVPFIILLLNFFAKS